MLDFTNRSFGEIVRGAVNVEIYSAKYETDGTSKANRLRALWKLESDHIVGTLLKTLIDDCEVNNIAHQRHDESLVAECRGIATRLLAAPTHLEALKAHATRFSSDYMHAQIRRMEASVESDPAFAIGTAKELIETCCKTILAERGKASAVNPIFQQLLQGTLNELELGPANVSGASRGVSAIRSILGGLGDIGCSLADFRNQFGTGHGKHGHAVDLQPRHSKLAVGAAATLVRFLFDTHEETMSQQKEQSTVSANAPNGSSTHV